MNLLLLVVAVGLVVGELEVEEGEVEVVEVEEGEDTALTCPAGEFGACLWTQEDADTDSDCQVFICASISGRDGWH